MAPAGMSQDGRDRLIATVLREHQRTTGMAPAMGTTCRCGAWCTGSTDRTARAVPLRDRRVDDLAQHQADMIVAVLDAVPGAAAPTPTEDTR